MHGPTKIDYAKLLGFDLVSDELVEGVDFNNPTVGAKLGAKVGTTTVTKTEQPMLMDPPSEVAGRASHAGPRRKEGCQHLTCRIAEIAASVSGVNRIFN